jgi:hypothetical protein
MVRITISQAAFDAIASTLALGSVGYENATNEMGERLIWLDHSVVARLRSLRHRRELCHIAAGLRRRRMRAVMLAARRHPTR